MRALIPAIPVATAVFIVVVLVVLLAGGPTSKEPPAPTTPYDAAAVVNEVALVDGQVQTVGADNVVASGAAAAQDALKNPDKYGMSESGANDFGNLVTHDYGVARRARKRSHQVRLAVQTTLDGIHTVAQGGGVLQLVATISHRWTVKHHKPASKTDRIGFEFERATDNWVLVALARGHVPR